MWIVASFHSTSLPFIQILPVPGNAIKMLLIEDILAHSLLRRLGDRQVT